MFKVFLRPVNAHRRTFSFPVWNRALGLDQKDPGQVMEEIKLRLDAAPSSKMDPFNKMVNILSIVMALDSETAEHVKFDIGVRVKVVLPISIPHCLLTYCHLGFCYALNSQVGERGQPKVVRCRSGLE